MTPGTDAGFGARARSGLAGLALAVAAVGCGGPVADPVENVVLVSIDTLRADRLGAYGHTRPTSPTLDAYAARGAVFEDASSTAPWTQPAHASMLTGLYPAQARMRRVGDVLPAGLATLAERVRAGGFHTIGIVNSIFLAEGSGLHRGFDVWKRHGETHAPAGVADRITDAAIAALERAPAQRIFLFVHYYDVHAAYGARPRFEQPFLEGVELGRVERDMPFFYRVFSGKIVLTPGERVAMKRLYEAGIRQLDAELGRLLRHVESDLGWEETLVVVTSDHGDAFYENGRISHGKTLYQEVLHVPLILFGDAVPEGLRIPSPVSIVDVAPTVLAAAGLPVPEVLAGVDLASHWKGGAPDPEEREILAQSAPALEGDTVRMLRRGSLKLIEDVAADRRELYDLAADPGETRDLAAARPAAAAELDAALDAFFARHPDDHDGAAATFDPETEARLRDLGYLD